MKPFLLTCGRDSAKFATKRDQIDIFWIDAAALVQLLHGFGRKTRQVLDIPPPLFGAVVTCAYPTQIDVAHCEGDTRSLLQLLQLVGIDVLDLVLEVFQLLGQGSTVRQIAEMLFVSVKTVEAHREHIKQKMNFKSSAELLRYAIQFAM